MGSSSPARTTRRTPLVTTATRAWTDGNGNYIPDCTLLDPVANGECGPISATDFGTDTPPARATILMCCRGYGKRNYNWQFAAGVQHELLPGVSVNATYNRRSYGNFQVTR